MIRGRCPICSRPFEADSIAAHPAFPFCSPRCRLVDLGRWIDGDYAIPSREAAGEPEPSGLDEQDDDDAA